MYRATALTYHPQKSQEVKPHPSTLSLSAMRVELKVQHPNRYISPATILHTRSHALSSTK
jgi:hypothetical protein